MKVVNFFFFNLHTLHTPLHSTQTLLRLQKLDHPVRSADFSPDGSLVAVGMTNGEFVLLLTKDFSIMARKRDRSKTIQAIRSGTLRPYT